MRYLLQVNTGSFLRCPFSPDYVVSRVKNCLERVDVTEVIYGWTGQHRVHDALANLLIKRSIRQHLWLPVFSDTRHSASTMPFVQVDGEVSGAIRLREGEDFQFVCPSASENLSAVLDTFEFLAADLPLDGVFLDRIRYPSAANSPKVLMGCQCAQCQTVYEAAGVDIERIRGEIKRLLMPESLDEGRYHFADPDVEALFGIKRAAITKAVRKFCAFFRAKGLSIGLDAFAPIIADFVGQDVAELGNIVDFIKPMMYRCTHAPAGIPFEIDVLKDVLRAGFGDRLAQLWGGDMLSDEVNLKQMAWLQSASHNVYPGIEMNRIPGICDSTPEYLLKSIALAQTAGCECVVLSWDALFMPADILETLAKN